PRLGRRPLLRVSLRGDPRGRDRRVAALGGRRGRPRRLRRRSRSTRRSGRGGGGMSATEPQTAGPDTTGEPLLVARDLVKDFPIRGGVLGRTVGHVSAVAGVSLQVRRGETVGLVGESGCGKSTTGRMLLDLIGPSSGDVVFDGQSLRSLRGKQLAQAR